MATSAGGRPLAATEGFAQRESRPILWWAALGLAVVLFQIYLYAAWILSGDFTPAPVGPDPIPASTLFFVRAFEIGSTLTMFAVWYWAWRACKRDGRLALEAILVIGWALTWWQDNLTWWARTNWFYNAYLVNYGNWTRHIPGWVNPVSHIQAEPIFFTMFGYMGWFTWASMCAAWSMTWFKRRKPHLSTMQLIVIGWLTLCLFDLTAEGSFVRTGVYAIPIVVRKWSLWGGQTYQFPLYESLFFSTVWAAPGILFFFRDDKGHTIIDRGVDSIKSVRLRPWLRILAMTGFINLCWQPYNMVWTYITMTGDATPEGYPSYMRAGQCGEGTRYECGGPDYSIPTQTSTKDPLKPGASPP